MKKPAQYIASGALENYLLGELSLEEEREFQEMMARYPEVVEAFAELELVSERLLTQTAVVPSKQKKASLFAALDEMESNFPPILHANCDIDDYKKWTGGVEPPAEYDNIYFSPLDQSEQGATALVWMKEGSPAETHTDVIEMFYIMEGACTISIEGEEHRLQAGDYLRIPLFKSHVVEVTSAQPCKILLQRIAA